MALLEYVDPDEATGEAAALLEEHEPRRGSLLRPMLANHPPLLQAQMVYHENLMERGQLPRDLKELVGVVVSQANACDYCASSHREKLVEALEIPVEQVVAVQDAEFEALTERERTAVRFAEQVATDAHRVSETDLDRLRDVGFDSGAILELLGVVGMFLAANAYVNALSVDPTDRDVGLDPYLDPSSPK